MAYSSSYLDRLWRSTLLKRVLGFVLACGLLSLLWFNFGGKGQLGKTFETLSKQAAESNVSTSPALAGDRHPGSDERLHDVTTPSKSISSLTAFPSLAPPDNEEYMAICMAGQYCRAYLTQRHNKVIGASGSEKPIHGSSRVLHPSLLSPWHPPLLHF